MAKGIYVVVDQRDAKIRKVSLEILSEGRKVADKAGEPLVAVILGKGIEGLSGETAKYGADKVIILDDDKLEKYSTGAYTSALNKLFRKEEPQAVLIGNTAMGKDLAPRLAHRLGVGLASDCTGMEHDGGSFLVFKRPIYAGKAFEYTASASARPIMATIRPNTFSLVEVAGKGEVAKESAEIDADDLRAIVKEVVIAASKRPELTEANIIVSGGRGIKGKENIGILEELADTIGAAVGVSRAAVDSGWADVAIQVGQTGKIVAPTLYIACGISGAIQHLAGMGSSKVIVAINKDEEANIFNVADYGIVGDLFDVVPVLTQEFKKIVG